MKRANSPTLTDTLKNIRSAPRYAKTSLPLVFNVFHFESPTKKFTSAKNVSSEYNP